MYEWIVFLHVAGALAFVLGHGASAIMAVRLGKESRRERVAALLELSVSSYAVTYIGLLVLLAAGITAGFVGKWWRMGWIWTAIGILVALSALMGAFGTNYYARLRKAVGLPYRDGNKEQPAAAPVTDAELVQLLAESPAVLLAATGGGGLAVILWLMMFKPF